MLLEKWLQHPRKKIPPRGRPRVKQKILKKILKDNAKAVPGPSPKNGSFDTADTGTVSFENYAEDKELAAGLTIHAEGKYHTET